MSDSLKPFQFKNFQISQSTSVFRVGTDGVLLGSLMSCENVSNGLEVGTGTGLISLMAAQRNSSLKISALDISEKAHQLSEVNFNNSVFKERIQSVLCDFKEFGADVQYDLIFSNPPYFEENNSTKDVLARQQVELSFSELIKKASELISKTGLFSVIIPSEVSDYFIIEAEKFGFYLLNKINIYGIENGNLKRNILEFSMTERDLIISDFVIEKSPRQYSDQYLELTKEFHIFKK